MYFIHTKVSNNKSLYLDFTLKKRRYEGKVIFIDYIEVYQYMHRLKRFFILYSYSKCKGVIFCVIKKILFNEICVFHNFNFSTQIRIL